MRADVLTVMPPLGLNKFNANDCSLRSSLRDIGDDDSEMEPRSVDTNAGFKESRKQAWQNSATKPNSVSLSWAQNGHSHGWDDFGAGESSPPRADAAAASPTPKKRSQSVLRPATNGWGPGSEPPQPHQSPKGAAAPVQLIKPVVPPPRVGSASARRRAGSGAKLKTTKSREGSFVSAGGGEGGSCESAQEQRTSSPSPHRRISSGSYSNARTETPGRGGSPPRGNSNNNNNRPSRRRLPSKSEDVSLSNGDLLSPRSAPPSDRLQQSLNGTVASDTSDEFRQRQSSVGDGESSSSPSPSSSRAWDFFEEHVRTIHGSGDVFSKHKGPAFNASSTFHETMVDLFGYPDYSHPPRAPTSGLHSVAARGLVVTGAANRFLQLRKRSSVFGGRGERPPPDRKTAENAKRGWRILKTHVQENYASKRTSQAALSWSMLRQTLKGMSDREKTRLDLYRRYGVIPSLDSEGKPVMVNTMLSERARHAVASGARHPLLVHQQSSSHEVASTSSSSPTLLQSPRSPPLLASRDVAGSPQELGRRRRAQSSVVRGARANVRAQTAGPSVGGRNTGVNVGNGSGGMSRTGVRKSADLSRVVASSRSHTP